MHATPEPRIAYDVPACILCLASGSALPVVDSRPGAAPRDWQIECIARSELNRVHAIEIEQAFGCTSFNEQHHYVRHYK